MSKFVWEVMKKVPDVVETSVWVFGKGKGHWVSNNSVVEGLKTFKVEVGIKNTAFCEFPFDFDLGGMRLIWKIRPDVSLRMNFKLLL